jgi:hypothetical protein
MIHCIKYSFLFPILASLCIFFTTIAAAQQHPPYPIIVYANPADGLYFGAFYQGATGGTVIIYPDGSRSATGDIVLLGLGYAFAPAIFEVEGEPGTRVGIIYGSDATLTGSNGGTMTVHLGGSDPTSPFVLTIPPPGRTIVRIGGTLSVGTPLSNPVGSYSGTFTVTFIQE